MSRLSSSFISPNVMKFHKFSFSRVKWIVFTADYSKVWLSHWPLWTDYWLIMPRVACLKYMWTGDLL
jgi:hypothetical protein